MNRLVTTGEAAQLVNRAPSTIRGWAHLGVLAPFTLDDRGRPLYLDVDVYVAEREMRRRPKENSQKR